MAKLIGHYSCCGRPYYYKEDAERSLCSQCSIDKHDAIREVCPWCEVGKLKLLRETEYAEVRGCSKCKMAFKIVKDTGKWEETDPRDRGARP